MTSATDLASIIGFVWGTSTYNAEDWKLGDIFRSSPITISTPNKNYYDVRDANNAFATFRSTYTRTSANGLRMVVVGANDGQLHAFQTGSGAESWSIVPSNLIARLKYIAHASHPTALTHQVLRGRPGHDRRRVAGIGHRQGQVGLGVEDAAVLRRRPGGVRIFLEFLVNVRLWIYDAVFDELPLLLRVLRL